MRSELLEEVLGQQRQWAIAEGKTMQKDYISSVDENLWAPMSVAAQAAFQAGKGSELRDSEHGPAKMRALRSSSALCVNVFDHWNDKDSRPLTDALGVDQAAEPLRFEAQFPTKISLTNRLNPPPHLDVAIRLRSGVTVGIESKFTEWLDPRQPEVRKPQEKRSFPKYLADGRLHWADQGMPRCQALVESINIGTVHFGHLNAPQLLKHALGLGTQCGLQFSLFYLYYEWPCAQGAIHRQEISTFAAAVGEEIRFQALTYQDLFDRISKTTQSDIGYLEYLRRRYFPLITNQWIWKQQSRG